MHGLEDRRVLGDRQVVEAREVMRDHRAHRCVGNGPGRVVRLVAHGLDATPVRREARADAVLR